MTQEPFEELAHIKPKPKRPRSAKEIDDAENRVRWTRFSAVKRVHCYDCIQMIVDGKDVVPQRATWVRSQGGFDALYCTEHQMFRRAQEDGAFL